MRMIAMVLFTFVFANQLAHAAAPTDLCQMVANVKTAGPASMPIVSMFDNYNMRHKAHYRVIELWNGMRVYLRVRHADLPISIALKTEMEVSIWTAESDAHHWTADCSGKVIEYGGGSWEEYWDAADRLSAQKNAAVYSQVSATVPANDAGWEKAQQQYDEHVTRVLPLLRAAPTLR